MNEVLLMCLYEEWLAAGRCFRSADTDLWFKEGFCNFGESVKDAFDRLLTKKGGK